MQNFSGIHGLDSLQVIKCCRQR